MRQYIIQADAVALALTALLIAGLAIHFRGRLRARKEPVPDEPEGTAYRIYTSEFDLVLPAEELPTQLGMDHPDFARGWTDRSGENWEKAVAHAEASKPSESEEVHHVGRVREALALASLKHPGEQVAITFLVDQSGSMRGEPMAAVRCALEIAVSALQGTDIATEVLGFSTLGWHGGKARQLWRDRGSPKRPGRLCALLHIIYKSADEPFWSENLKRVMMHPDILRENIDGEALRWAASRLRRHMAASKILIVISDGAPVDDSTLLENGPRYLERDIRGAITEIETANDISLGAVGVGDAVDQYYKRSMFAATDGLTTALINQIIAMIRLDSPGQS